MQEVLSGTMGKPREVAGDAVILPAVGRITGVRIHHGQRVSHKVR